MKINIKNISIMKIKELCHDFWKDWQIYDTEFTIEICKR